MPPPKRKGYAMANQEKMWATLVHLGYNMWGDQVHRYIPKVLSHLSTDVMRVDEERWVEYTEILAQNGCNTLIVDVGEALRYESHPELAVEGTWSREKLQKDLARLRSIGFTEIIPKLNFGAGHDTWLKQYDHMLSSKIYYEVTRDLIHEALEVFDTKHIHLGMDEEQYRFQNPTRRGLAIIRRRDGWWRDLYHLVNCAEEMNARAWVWSDPIWYNPDEFVRKMPKSVIQCNWYYGANFGNTPGELPSDHSTNCLGCFDLLDQHGFDQMPTGSNCYGAEQNLLDMTKFCWDHLDHDRFLGLMDAPWGTVRRQAKERQDRSAVHLGEARAWFEEQEKESK